ncbi:hypothetical protein EZV62_019454 [Acer yangbiense]|uniref:DUF4283 domain-containing protein n=1 Tax=Acer yangbiense TaxID=1000413 RepID=A0A5C7HBE1_9ROSI|nr:hypothetical protein EZV62_019454 [Acer yangbiense]
MMNPADLEMLCSALSIREKERPVGTLTTNLKERGERLLSLCLVGKVLTNKLVNKEAFINVMTSIWKVKEGVEIEALEGNVFAFHFKILEDRKFIQSGGPWTFDRAITAFEEPSGTGDIAHMKFKTVEFWVQIHNLPLLCMTEDTGTFLGSMIEEVKEVDLLTAKNIGGVALFKFSRLGHPFKDCPEPGAGKEDTTEAMARVNVWLRIESPPKRFNHRSGPFERKSWTQKLPESSSGGRKQIGGKQISQTGELHHLEPNTNLMRNDSVINALKDKTMSVNKTSRVAFSVKKGKAVQMPRAVIVKEKKRNQNSLSVGQTEVDRAAVLGSTDDLSQVSKLYKVQAVGSQMVVDLPIVIGSTEEPVQVSKRENQEGEVGIQSEGKKVKISNAINQARLGIAEATSLDGNQSQNEVLQGVP